MSIQFEEYNPTMVEEIKRLFSRTFTASEDESEGALIGNLAGKLMTETEANDLHVFVATEDERIVGSIIFSRLTFETDTNAFILAPVAIGPDHQGKGIGQALIKFGLNFLKNHGVELVITYGDPNFYSKVGFHQLSEDSVKAPLTLSQPEGWLGQSLVSGELKPIPGRSYCVNALNNPVYW